ncbi:MAG: F0F1 ATP synthase subunit gamma [Methylococcales bacterium]|nr:MAG: F0F1 ATP synthase subunit gamma [Methylococcales bacterium]
MSQSRELQLRITQMEEIRSILNAMKNLALIEIHKLTHYESAQSLSVTNIEHAAQDFLAFHPQPIVKDQTNVIAILIGAERGFCGDFNEKLISFLSSGTYSGIIAIGTRLCNRLSDHPLVIAAINGANTAEEVSTILNQLIDAITAIPSESTDSYQLNYCAPSFKLTAIYHDHRSSQISQRQIVPAFSPQVQKTSYVGNAPILNLKPTQFFSELSYHHLYAVLHEIFYLSLLAENQQRLQHLEGAVKHLDDATVNLQRKSQIYRQEEITEEIEVILLNSENL